MNEQYVNEQRAKLVREFWFLRSKKLILSARARVRKIADFDLEHYGTPREETFQKFNYNKLK